MKFLAIAQIVVSIVLIILILLQERETGVSGLFGGGGDGGFYQKRRGLERIIFILTIVLIAVFAGLALLNLAL